MSNVATVGAANFENEVIQEAQPVVVDFTATWCPPCKMLAPVLDKVADKFAEQAKFVKCDIDENPALASQYGVMTIPNLIFFKNGQVVDQSVGYMSETQLSDKVKNVIGS